MNKILELINIYEQNGHDFDDKTIREAFGRSLKKLREHKQLTQGQLSDETYISRQSISVYEKGEITPTLTSSYKIASYFNLSVEDFIIYGIGAQEVFDEKFSDITDKYDFENMDF